MFRRLLAATHRRQPVTDCGLLLGPRQAPAHIDPWPHHDPLRAPRLRTIYYQRHTLDGELPLLEDAPGLGVGDPLPDVPPEVPEFTAAEFAGLYRGETGYPTIKFAGEQVVLLAGSERVALGPARLPPLLDAFVAGHPDFALFPLRFGRDGAGSVVELTHGGT